MGAGAVEGKLGFLHLCPASQTAAGSQLSILRGFFPSAIVASRLSVSPDGETGTPSSPCFQALCDGGDGGDADEM